MASEARTRELQRDDLLQLHRAAQAPTAPVPPVLHRSLARLLPAVRLPAGVQVTLVGVPGGRDASVLSTGTILVGSRLWQGDAALDEAELAAVLAHELAHLEAGDVRHRLCEAVALSGNDQVALASATLAIHRVIWSGRGDVAVQLMQRNHARELRADGRGAALLRQAGVPVAAMATMLLKVTRNGGRDSGSHPAVETRLEHLGMPLASVVPVDGR